MAVGFDTPRQQFGFGVQSPDQIIPTAAQIENIRDSVSDKQPHSNVKSAEVLGSLGVSGADINIGVESPELPPWARHY